MRFVKTLAYVLVIIGALNWGLVGFFNFDLVAAIFGEMTFTSLGGLMNFYSEDFQLMTGNIIDINYKG